jgi:hypothetical protein
MPVAVQVHIRGRFFFLHALRIVPVVSRALFSFIHSLAFLSLSAAEHERCRD